MDNEYSDYETKIGQRKLGTLDQYEKTKIFKDAR